MRIAVVLLLAATACARNGAVDATASQRVSERVLPEEGLVLQEVDLDADGTPEVWNWFRERSAGDRVPVKKAVDLDRDGDADVISHFDGSGSLEREEMDADFDGLVDWVDHYKDGIRVLAEVDTNFDGRPDIFTYYVRGADGLPRVDRKESDTTGDGRIDLWERFDAEGRVIRTGRDTDGDGKMDERDD